MAYASKSNLPQFGGSFSPWAQNFANWALRELLSARSHVPFLRKHDFGPICLIVPTIEPDKVSVLALYGLKRAALVPSLLTGSGLSDRLQRDWKQFSRAFVRAEVGRFGQLEGLNHNATLRASNELLRSIVAGPPGLSEIDITLSTSLDLIASGLHRTNRKLINEICR